MQLIIDRYEFYLLKIQHLCWLSCLERTFVQGSKNPPVAEQTEKIQKRNKRPLDASDGALAGSLARICQLW